MHRIIGARVRNYIKNVFKDKIERVVCFGAILQLHCTGLKAIQKDGNNLLAIGL